MKKALLSLLGIFTFFICANAQQTDTSKTIRKCGSADAYNQRMAMDPDYKAQSEQLEKYVDKWVSEHPDYEAKTTATIPVVVHIIYKTAAENVSDLRVTEQIAETNADWAGTNTHSMGSFATSLKANSGIQFCLATIDPNGNATSGITRTQTTVASFNITGYPANCNGYPERCTSKGGCDAWDVSKYLNIWVCNAGNGLCGISEFPTTPLDNYYGTTIHYEYFGHTGASTPYNLGGTYTHEAGHCFNLYHVWGDDGGTCSGSDNCTDTPNQSSENYGANTGVVTDNCTTTSPGIMYMNFMDYSDDISYANFTPNQVARMQAMIAANGPCYSLTQSKKCSGVGIEEEKEIVSNIIIYPNPSEGNIHLEFDLDGNQDVVITITDVLGNVVKLIEKKAVDSINMPVDFSDQANGMYYVNIKTQHQTVTEKVAVFK
jgi:hypothetical protein